MLRILSRRQIDISVFDVLLFGQASSDLLVDLGCCIVVAVVAVVVGWLVAAVCRGLILKAVELILLSLWWEIGRGVLGIVGLRCSRVLVFVVG